MQVATYHASTRPRRRKRKRATIQASHAPRQVSNSLSRAVSHNNSLSKADSLSNNQDRGHRIQRNREDHSKMSRNRINYILTLLITVATTLVSCNRKTVYDHYEPTPLTGWEKNDTLIYRMPVFDEGGEYSETLGLRIGDNYPFTSICIIVDNTIISKDNTMGLSTVSDTITCSLFDSDGSIKGNGVSIFQYNSHIKDLSVEKGDSVEVRVRHNMKREILHGIMDIGIQLNKK